MMHACGVLAARMFTPRAGPTLTSQGSAANHAEGELSVKEVRNHDDYTFNVLQCYWTGGTSCVVSCNLLCGSAKYMFALGPPYISVCERK